MALFDQLRFWNSQAIYWRYAVIADPSQPLPVRRLLAKLAPSPYHVPHDTQRLILIPVPKVSGNSLIFALYGADGTKILGQTPQHTPALVFKFFDPVRFSDYFKIAFVRNPWDRLVSAYAFMKAGGKHIVDGVWAQHYITTQRDFATFVKSLDSNRTFRASVLRSPHFIPQAHFVCGEDGEVAVDFLGTFETMDEDFAKLRDILGLARDLPKANVGDHEDYRYYYDSDSRRVVGEIYAKDVELFDYEFDG